MGKNGILCEFEKLEKESKKKLPYHFNLIDLLRPQASEPTHSRILGTLLKQNKNGDFHILEQFIKYLKLKKGLGSLRIERPRIYIETEGVDIWVLDEKPDKGQALIIENKVRGALDQPKQLFRYIKATQGRGFRCENIYVIYMPGYGEKEPDDQSWGGLKTKFKNRYVSVTFRELLKWLNEELLPWATDPAKNEIFLSSALVQYIDYLEGENMFQSHERFNIMNEKLKKLIRRKLKVGESPADDLTESAKRVDIISQKRELLDKVMNSMEKIEETVRKEMFQSLKKQIEEKYGNLGISISTRDDRNGACLYLDIPFPQEGPHKTFNVSIMDAGEIYYGITASDVKNKGAIKKLLKPEYFQARNYTWSDDSGELLCYHKELDLSDINSNLLDVLHLFENMDSILRKK